MTASRESRFALLLAAAAATTQALAIVIAGALEPGYSHAHQFVSELGAVGAAQPAILNFGGLIPSGVLTIVLAIVLFRRLESRRAFVIGSALVAVVGAGRALAGVFPCDPGCSMVDMSLAARVHALAGFAALMGGALAPIVMSMGLRSLGRSGTARLWLGLGLAGLALAIFMFGSGPGTPYLGLVQRAILLLVYAWMILAAIDLRSES